MMETDSAESQRNVPAEAEHVYLLMKDNVRISRNSRASWYFRHLNSTIKTKAKNASRPQDADAEDSDEDTETEELLEKPEYVRMEEEKNEEEFEILTVLPRTYKHTEPSTECNEYRITADTNIVFLAKKYSLVFILDISPSAAAPDLQCRTILLEQIFESLCNVLKGVAKPIQLPGYAETFQPQLYVTVIACSPLISKSASRVLIQGHLVNDDNVHSLIDLLKSKFSEYEVGSADSMAGVLHGQFDDESDDSQKMTGGIFEDIIDRPEYPDRMDYMMTADVAFVNMIRYGMLGLQLLPENSASIIVVFTDGVVGVPEASVFESLMAQLRHNTISCSFIPVSSQFSVGLRLGQVPYVHLLQFIATATLGAYFSKTPDVETMVDISWNVYHRGLLSWSFQVSFGGQKVDSLSSQVWQELDEDLAWSSRSFKSSDTQMWLTPLMKKKHTERVLQISLAHLISCRLREGYIIKDVKIKKGESEINVVLVLPWRDNVWIYYEAHSNWPLSLMKRHTRVDITVEASYEFLHDVTCPLKKPFKSPYRTSLVKKYWQTLQVMSETDMMLGHLQSFASNPTYYRVPDSVMNGVPLFYLPANSTNPQLSLQHSSKDTSLNQFATFWKAVLHLDGNAWQKWLHTQRLTVILAHDIQLGKHLHIPNSSDRYHTITCRQSLTNLHFCLISWMTFVLLENHSYIKLLFDDPDKPPISFFVLRLTLKPPCMVMRLAFLGGTPGYLRRKTIEELVEEINKLTFPQRGPHKDDKVTTRQHRPGNLKPIHVPPLQRQLSEKLCCIIPKKPMEMILVRYERTPLNYIRDLPGITGFLPYGKTGSANTSGSTVQFMLSQYLHHQRWVWTIQHGMPLPIPMQAVDRILRSLTKIRLQEGFMFAHAASGIINMVLEIDMKISEPEVVDDSADRSEDPLEGTFSQPSGAEDVKPCVLQYVLFPPHTTTNKHESESEDDADDRQDTAEADGELQIITEVWVEPECGKVINSSPERKHFDGINFQDVSQAMFPTDLECISTMVTFEHLQLMCQSLSSSFNTLHDLHAQKMTWSTENLEPNLGPSSSIHTVPFSLDVMRLLPKCQQVELLFSTYIQDVYKLRLPQKFNGANVTESPDAPKSDDRGPNDRLFDLFLESMREQHDLELHLTDSDCERVLRLIRERDRDPQEHPLPFVLEDDTLEGFEGSCNRSESTISVAASVASTHVSSSTTVTSSKTAIAQPTLKRALTNQMHRRLSVGSGLPRERNEDSMCNDDSKSALRQTDVENLPKILPRWRCFVKHVCANHIILCFIPATYDDLRFLVQGRAVLRMAEIFQMMVDETRSGKDGTSEQGQADDSTDALGEDQIIKIQCSGKLHVETPTPVSAKCETMSAMSKSLGASSACHDKVQTQLAMIYKEKAADPKTGEAEIIESPSAPSPASALESDMVTSTPIQSPQRVVNSEGCVEIDEDSRTDTQYETFDEMTVQQDGVDLLSQPISYKSFPIPVYVYNCPLSSLTDQLVNKWTYYKPPDLYQDMNIIREEQSETSRGSSKEDLTMAESQDEADHPEVPRRQQDSETLRDRLSTMKDELASESSNAEQDSLKQHCTLISEYYLRCFVIGIFQSLLHSQEVTDKDIDAAINAICEESSPRETDLTRYLQNVCGHVRRVIKKATVEQVIKEDLLKTLPKTALSPESQDSGDTKDHDSDLEVDETIRSSLAHLGSVTVPLTLLQCETPCESMPNLHKVIKEKFTAILHQYFQPVQSNPDYKGYFFYCPPAFWRRREYSEDAIDFEASCNGKLASSGDESDIFQSDAEGQDDQGKKSEQDSVTSNKDSGSLDSLSAGDLDLDGNDEDDEEDNGSVPPLFIHLTCSVRTSIGKTLQSVAVTDLPTCFGELKSCLKDLPEEVDLQDIEVTLDMICLTLPPEVDEEMPQKRPCFNRLTSFTSQISVDSDHSPSPEDREDAFSFAATFDTGYLKQNSADIIKNLPKPQRAAIDECQKQIQWLLQDEIASALRLMLPVSADTLEMVANHVNNSVDRVNCIAEEVPLQFVFGPEQSLSHFIEDFERMNLPGYHLQKEGKFYFLSLNRVHFHAEALRCAMENLKGVPSPVGKPEMDISVEVLCKSEAQDDNVELFNPEDIKISVIRPSPVKEVNSFTEEPIGRKTADEQGDDSSDSSIQVLDPSKAEDIVPGSSGIVIPGEFKLAPLLPVQQAATSTAEENKPAQTDDKKSASTEGTRRKSEEGKISRTPSMKADEDRKKTKEDGEKSQSDANEKRLRRFHRKSSDSPLTRSFEIEQKPHTEQVTRSQSEESADQHCLPVTQRQLSPLTVTGVDSKDSNMRRVHSSASFEKYKRGQSRQGINNSKSGGTTPIGRQSDVQTPRSHHPSGLHTPMSNSMYYPSSRSSIGEEGYEGDSSDLDEDGAMMSFSDRGNTRLLMPNFWLIMEITQDKVHVFFHARDSYEEESEESIHQKNLYNNVIDHINEICKIVNQRLLLRDLNQTRMCNKLLVCEADEDVRWAKDKYHSLRSRKTEDSDDSDTDAPQDRYLHAALKLMPGHFACEKVCTIPFVLHPRLKTGHSRMTSRGVQALLSVLNKFSVNNRKNLFVIKDTSENVFYLRLEEGQKGDFRTDFSSVNQKDEDHSLAASRSSSLLSLPTKKVINEIEEDAVYLNTRHYSIGEKPGVEDANKNKGELLYLTVHGISPASAEITQDLSQLLRKKLDDVVLDILTMMLVRNPMCKLMPEDVEFIQVVGKPNEVVRLTIPSAAMLQQYALGYYLRQNLLQFLSTPKYADPRQSTVFKDYSQSGSPAILDNVVFLYNRPQQAGGKGIACLQMQFVDGRGNPILLLSGPKPSPHSYKDHLEKNDFEKLVNTSIYQVVQGSKKPDESEASSSTDDQLCHGPTALVQFNIWERGDVDMYQLRELLVKAMKHAACDVILEYQLLTAPLCEVPMQPLSSMTEHHGLSGTASPKVDTPDGSRTGSHEPLKRMPSDKVTPKDKSATFNILTDVFKSKNRDSPKDTPASPIPSEVDEMKKKEMEVEQQRVLKYEQGDRGTLNSVFTDVLPTWLEFANSLDVPSIQKSQFTLVSRTAVEYVLKEFQSTVNKVVSDIYPKVFRFVDGVAGATNPVYIPYSPSRAPMSAQDTKLESSMDFASHTPCGLPGRSCCFVSVGRNVNQWKASIHYTEEDEMTSEITSQNNPKTHKGHQRFPAYDPTIYTVDRGEGGLSVPPTPTVANMDAFYGSGLSPKEAPYGTKSGPDFSGAIDPIAALMMSVKVFVPRQRFILLSVQDKEFCLYTYNWPSEHNSHLEKHMAKVIQWHNARDHLLSCILVQKMGLFQHVLFGDVPADPQTESNPFIQNVGDIDTLVRYTSPLGPSLQTTQTRSRQPSAAITPPVLFEDLYRDTQPSVAMHKATYGNLRDPLHKHGAQMMELRSRLRREAERNDKLSGLYMMWQQRMGSTPISEDVLELLKSSSRLVHSVATPLLFSPQWRRRVLPKPTIADVPPPQPVETKQARSRHSSGASIRSKRSDSMDGKIRIGVDSPDSLSRQVPYEEGWHMDLRHSFTNQYVQYLQSLLFVQINTRPPTPRRTNSRQRSGEKSNREDSHNAPVIHKDFIYLQKTFPGGIILLELGFKDLNFCVNVYAFECSRLPVGKTVNPQLAVIFTEELDKFKDLTHVHSFAHDFHLRIVQSYVGNNQQLVFKHGYHLTNFLHDFIIMFPYVPSFSRNFIYEASIQIDNTNSPGNQLFDYMLNHDRQYGMRAIRMIPCDDDIDQEHEYALVMQFHCDEELCEVDFQRVRPQDYEVGLVLTHQPGPRYSDLERHTLRLKFFIVLTSKMEMFPRDKLEKKLWAFKSGSLRRYTARARTRLAGFNNLSLALTDENMAQLSISQHRGVSEDEMGSWNETINYLGYSNKHQAIGYILLQRLADIAKSKVQHMVENAMQQCRRDSLWRRMLLPPTIEDEGRRKRRSERQPESDDNFLTLLTFAEFEELLDIISKEQLERLDHRLAMLQNMSLMWYQGLVRVLISKYQDNHRLFVTNEGHVKHLVVLNPNHLDAFMMLTIENNKASLKAVYRETMPELNHTPDNPNLPALAMQSHIEGFVNACCYHMWSVLTL